MEDFVEVTRVHFLHLELVGQLVVKVLVVVL